MDNNSVLAILMGVVGTVVVGIAVWLTWWTVFFLGPMVLVLWNYTGWAVFLGRRIKRNRRELGRITEGRWPDSRG